MASLGTISTVNYGRGALKFTFAGERCDRYTLSEIHITLHPDASTLNYLPSLRRLGIILSGLSNSPSCRCHFNLSDMYASDAVNFRRLLVQTMGRPEHLMYFRHNGELFGYGEAVLDDPWSRVATLVVSPAIYQGTS